ncbi:MAG: ribonuclease H-like domain-containing protein [Bellilinea sp.]
MDDSLLNRLRSLGIQVGNAPLSTNPPPRVERLISIEKVVNGINYPTIFGDIFISEKQYPVDYNHGIIDFSSPPVLSSLIAWSRIPIESETSIEEFVFLDTETSGLSGGTGTFVFLIGLGYWKNDHFLLTQIFLRDPSEEPAFLTALEEFLTPFKILVTYNGKSFDAPLLNNRFILNGFQSPVKRLHHIDLLSLTRRVWRNRLDDRSLANLEREILNLARAEEEIPGWMVPQIYFEYLQTQNPAPLRGVFYHNEVDILSLSALFLHLANLLRDPLGSNNPQSLDLIAIARLYEELGDYTSAIQLYEASLEIGLPAHFFIQTLYRFANLHRRTGKIEASLNLWLKAAEFYEVDACIQIAKFYEHQQKSFQQAIEWTELALTYLDQSPLPRYLKKQRRIELEHRKQRLFQKQNRSKNQDIP